MGENENGFQKVVKWHRKKNEISEFAGDSISSKEQF
jgi:hypothetical protein